MVNLNGLDYIKIVDGEVTVNNINTPKYYVNAVADERVIARADSWYHVAVTTATGINASDVDIGRLEGGDPEYFAGKIDEVRLWDDVRTVAEILANYNRSIANPYDESSLKLYLRMNNDPGTVAFDHSSNMEHGTINGSTYTSGSISWTSNSNLGNDGEAGDWSTNNDVDDFYKTGPDSPLLDDGFSGLGRRIYVKYVSVLSLIHI